MWVHIKEYQPKPNAVNIIYNTLTNGEIDDRLQRLGYVDACIIERKMYDNALSDLGDWQSLLDDDKPVIVNVATSIYLANIMLAVLETKFQYPIYFTRIGRSVKDNEVLYTTFDLSIISGLKDTINSIQTELSILF